MCPLLPKRFSVMHHGLGQEVTEVDLEYIWLRKQIRLVYLSTSHPLRLLYLLSFFFAGGHSCVSSVSSPVSPQTKTSMLISLTAALCKTERI